MCLPHINILQEMIHTLPFTSTLSGSAVVLLREARELQRRRARASAFFNSSPPVKTLTTATSEPCRLRARVVALSPLEIEDGTGRARVEGDFVVVRRGYARAPARRIRGIHVGDSIELIARVRHSPLSQSGMPYRSAALSTTATLHGTAVIRDAVSHPDFGASTRAICFTGLAHVMLWVVYLTLALLIVMAWMAG